MYVVNKIFKLENNLALAIIADVYTWMIGRSSFGWVIAFWVGERLGDMRTKLNPSPFLSLSHKQDREYRN